MDDLDFRLAKVFSSRSDAYKNHPPDKLYDLAVECLDREDFTRAASVFRTLSRIEGKHSFPSMIESLVLSEMAFRRPYDADTVEMAKKHSMYAMAESLCMHCSDEIPLEKLLIVERLVDRLSGKVRTSVGYDQYEKFYLRFKEYVLEKYVNEI